VLYKYNVSVNNTTLYFIYNKNSMLSGRHVSTSIRSSSGPLRKEIQELSIFQCVVGSYNALKLKIMSNLTESDYLLSEYIKISTTWICHNNTPGGRQLLKTGLGWHKEMSRSFRMKTRRPTLSLEGRQDLEPSTRLKARLASRLYLLLWKIGKLTLILLTWRIGWAHNNGRK